ncbi:MAG: hypothetical protein RLZ98_215 [Pseudomonadota bacterium]
MRKLLMTGLISVVTVAGGDAFAAGRYTMMPSEDGGFIRLDTETGDMALCRKIDASWSCRPLAEQRSSVAEENNRLRKENEKLRAELKQLEGFVFPREGGGGKPGEPGRTLQLPSEEDVDKALTYMQRLIRKFKEKMEELEKESTSKPSGPPTPL